MKALGKGDSSSRGSEAALDRPEGPGTGKDPGRAAWAPPGLALLAEEEEGAGAEGCGHLLRLEEVGHRISVESEEGPRLLHLNLDHGSLGQSVKDTVTEQEREHASLVSQATGLQ